MIQNLTQLRKVYVCLDMSVCWLASAEWKRQEGDTRVSLGQPIPKLPNPHQSNGDLPILGTKDRGQGREGC